MVFLLPETAFDRNAVVVDEKEARRHPFLNYRPLPEKERTKPWGYFIRFLQMFRYYDIAIAVVYFCWTYYWWVLTVITMVPAAYEQYAADIQGLLFIGLIVGTVISEIFLSGSLSDRLVARLAAKNNGIRTPEQRLWLMHPASVLTFVGITLFGWSVDKNTHWVVGQVGTALFAADIQIGNTSISAYFIDCEPEQTMSSVAFYTVRTIPLHQWR